VSSEPGAGHQAAWMIEVVFAFFLVAIFVGLVLSVRSQRYSDELNSAIAAMEADSASMETFIKREYSYESIDAALEQLERAKTSMLQILLYMTRNLKNQ
jgi:hypothetical protein